MWLLVGLGVFPNLHGPLAAEMVLRDDPLSLHTTPYIVGAYCVANLVLLHEDVRHIIV